MIRPSIPLLMTTMVGVLASVGCPSQVPNPGTCNGVACEEEKSAEPPRLFVDPPFGLGYDCVTIGCDSERKLVIENRGGGKVRLVLARLNTTTSRDFVLRGGDDSVLPFDDATAIDVLPGKPLEMFVRYVPTDGTADAGTVELKWHDGTKPYEDTTRTISVANTGDGGVMALGPVSLEDVTSPVFQPATDGAWDVQFINPDASGTIDVTFRPDSVGTFVGALQVQTNDGALPSIRVEVAGTAVGDPDAVVGVEAVDFQALRIGATRTLPLVVTNAGGAPLTLLAGISAGSDLVLTPAEPLIVAPLESTTLQIAWTPTQGGVMNGTVTLQTNDPGQPTIDVAVSGFSNAPSLTATPTIVDFGQVVQGWQTGAQTFLLTNTGSGDLTITSVAFDQSQSSGQIRFVGVPPLPIKLSPGAPAVEVSVALDATTIGSVQAVIHVGTDSIDNGLSITGVTALLARASVVSCEVGCPLTNAEPSCTTNECRIGECANTFHDANNSVFDGCECGEDFIPAGAGRRRDVPGTCGGMDLGTLNDKDNPRSTTFTGTLHDINDIDLFFFRANDQSQFLNDSYGARVDLLSGPPGLRLFARFGPNAGCGGETQRSGPVGPGQGLQGRNNGTGDDDEDVTVWVEWAPGSTPVCANYTVRFRADNDN